MFDLRIWAAGHLTDLGWLTADNIYSLKRQAEKENSEIEVWDSGDNYRVFRVSVSNKIDDVVAYYKVTVSTDSYDRETVFSVTKVEPKEVTKVEWV